MSNQNAGKSLITAAAIYCLLFGTLYFASAQRRSEPTAGSGVEKPRETVLIAESPVSRYVAARRAAREFQRNEKQGSKGDSDYLTSLIAADPELQKGFGVLACDTGQNIDVEASAGTTQAGYATLGAAFAAINAGIHQGDIAVEICGSTTEAGSSVLHSSGAGPASYDSIEIYPLMDNASIEAATAQGRGVIELNGADNVTIDGDNPNTAGINRDLTVRNSAASATNHTQVIRIAINTTTVASADNNSILNLSIIGSAVGRNTASFTAIGNAENTTHGIVVAGGVSGPTTDPSAIMSVTTTVGFGASAANLFVSGNSIVNVARGVVTQGSAASVLPNLLIENNIIGNPTEGEIDQVYSIGVSVQGSTDAFVRRNIIYVESFLAATSGGGIRGLDQGFVVNTVGGTSVTTFERNEVRRVRSRNPTPRGANGISLSGANNHVVRNNFVSGVSNTQTLSGPALNPNSAAVGIRAGMGTGHQILHNSVHFYGVQVGSMDENFTAAFALVPTTVTNLNVRNNIFSNQMSGGNPTGTRHVAIFVPDAGSSIGLVLNNNAYYQGTATNSRMARRGTDMFDPAVEYQATNFNPSATTPSTNFRAHSTLLGAFGNSNDNASFATTAAPPFVSDSDLHIPTAVGGPLDGGGADVGVVDDIDGDLRGSQPEIGADELVGPTSANLPISGRVVTAGGRGLANASVRLEGGPLSDPRSATTNAFGFFVIEGVPAGYTYLISVNSRRFVFAEPVRVITLDDKIGEIVFTALP